MNFIIKLLQRKPKTYLEGHRCCDCNKRLIGEKDVPSWEKLEAGSSHDVELVCSRCGKKQYTWKGFYKP